MQQSITSSQLILIIDFGSQYTQLIARRVRAAGVYCEIHPCEISPEAIRDYAPMGVILSGGPESIRLADAPKIPPVIFELGVPVLGICYGMQAMAHQLGGQVQASHAGEFGFARCFLEATANPLLSGLADGATGGRPYLDVWMSHGDQVSILPPDFGLLASSDNAPIAAMKHLEKPWFGVQFHPEVTHTPKGQQIIENFALTICGCQKLWTAKRIIEGIVEDIQAQVQGNDKVILGLSGGVDSTVAATLLHSAIGDRLICIFVDNGLLRKGEVDAVMNRLSAQGDNRFGLDVRLVSASQKFLEALKGIQDPEAKRKQIGQTFIEVFEQQANSIAGANWLGQGTIYSDVIESAASRFKKAHAIKSHHNVGGLPERMSLKLIEPLRELFKDEVRRIGLTLGIPDDLIHRHPFPGPGLGVRILGEVREEYADLLRAADAIFIEELETADLYHKVSQAFAVFLPVQSVGVVGDTRRYEYVIALRAVETIDFMTARWAELPHAFLSKVANRIINELSGVSRVVYDISSKPPATIEWE